MDGYRQRNGPLLGFLSSRCSCVGIQASPSVFAITDLGVSTPVTGEFLFSHVSLP